MPDAPAAVYEHPQQQVWVLPLGYALLLSLLAWVIDSILSRYGLLDGSWGIFWPLNGVTTALLLSRKRQDWPFILGCVGIATAMCQALSAGRWGHGNWTEALVVAALNAIEVWIAASILPAIHPVPDDHIPQIATQSGEVPGTELRQWLREPRLMYRFTIATFIAAPGASGVLAATYYHFKDHIPFWHIFHQWALADALGLAATIPLVLALRTMSTWRGDHMGGMLRTLGMVALMAAATIAVFSQSQPSLLFTLFPVLGLVIFYSTFTGAMLAIQSVCVLSVAMTLHQHAFSAPDSDRRVLFLQLFLALIVLVGFQTSVLLTERRAFAVRLRKSERQYRLLAESSRDVILLTDLAGTCEFVSPASREVLGYEPHELLGQPFQAGVHEDDLENCLSLLQDIRLSLATEAVLTYRTRTRDGRIIWVEGRLRATTDEISGDVTGSIITLRDITEHKRLQMELEDACTKLEHQASFDALTNIANRRRFDAILDQEWRRAAREFQPLALVLIDVDNFKTYNDANGHPAGDQCLRLIAQTLTAFARRPGDLVARYGGEEFALLLPMTDQQGSCDLAEKIRRAIEDLRLTHPGSDRGVATISAGCAGGIPMPDISPTQLIEEADRALYLAKANGRNRVESKPGPRPVRDSNTISFA